MIDVVFWALSFLCCLVLPSLALGVPSVLAASAAIRRHAEWRTRAAIAAGLANGMGSAVLHALVGFVLGVDVGEGSTGVALGVSIAGMVVGFALGGGARPLRAGGALALSIVGVVLAALIAAFGPTFFERLVEGAASGLGAVT